MNTVTTLAPSKVEEQAPTKEGGSKKKKLVIALVALLAVGGGYWTFLRPSGDAAPEPGAIVALDATQINLAGGHYLKIGIALQLTTAAAEVDGSKALDATIDLFSGLSLSKVTLAGARHQLQEELTKELEKRYEGEVMGVYFTEFVTQ